TSFYAMYDFAKTIGGDDIDLTNIVPTGTEPHDFEPTASDMAKLSEADIFIYNGVGMESWADKIIETLPQT
ncbi:ABC transporter metal-binding lipoprotein, partial [human gut metagenome]